MAQREKLEKLQNVFVLLGFDVGDQEVINKLELPVSMAVPGPVHRLTGRTDKKAFWFIIHNSHTQQKTFYVRFPSFDK